MKKRLEGVDMDSRIKWNNNRLDELDMKVREGLPLKVIGSYFGVSRQRLYQVMQKYGIETKLKQKRERACEGDPIRYKLYHRLKNNQNLLNKKHPGVYKNDATIEDLLPAPEVCPILGERLEYLDYLGRGHPSYASIDRIDPTLGYDSGNVHIISNRANRIKNNSTPEELRKIADYIDNVSTLT
jgi:hypothetical protein